MTAPVLIRPNGPQAIVGILLNKYYSTEDERLQLVESLLSSWNPDPEELDCIGKLLRKKTGRRALGLQIDRAYEKLAIHAPSKDCLVVFCDLPADETTGRMMLLRKVCKLGRVLVTDSGYRSMFVGHILFRHERDLLRDALGGQVFLDRLMRAQTERPALRLAAG